MQAFVNKRCNVIVESGWSLGRTFLICILLTVACIVFSKDAQDLVLEPIERMIVYVKKIAQNPLLAKDEEENIDLGNVESSL